MYSSGCNYCRSQAIKVINTIAIWKQHLSQAKLDVGRISYISHYSTFFPLLHHHGLLSSVTFYTGAFYTERYMLKKPLARYVC